MSVGNVVICLFLGLIALAFGSAAVRVWRKPGFDPANTPMVRMTPMSEEGRHALGRAILPLAVGYLALAVMISIMAANPDKHSVWGAAVYVSAGLMMLSWLLVVAVAWFNWPKVLVPPHLRSDVGLISNWWLKRRQVGRGVER